MDRAMQRAVLALSSRVLYCCTRGGRYARLVSVSVECVRCRAIARPRASDLYLQSGLHVLSESGVVREMCCENDVSSVEGRATKDDVLGVVRTRRL